jgi:hypothetical protein
LARGAYNTPKPHPKRYQHEKKKGTARPPKVSDLQFCASFILILANLNRARKQRIKRFSGKVFWGKKKGYKAGGGKRFPYLLTFMATL